MTTAERVHLSRVVSMGCVICGRPAEIHHLRSGLGLGQRAPHSRVIGLCDTHHRTGGHGVAFHAGRRTWEVRYGTEEELLARVEEQLAMPVEVRVGHVGEFGDIGGRWDRETK